jgi:hypothetical protein
MLRRSTLRWTTRTLSLAAALVVSLAPLAAQDDSGAKVLVQVGQVSVMNGGYLQVLNVGDKVRMQQMIVTGPDGYAQFKVLSDGSTFEVFPNSKVVFRDTPGNWKNLLNVWIGHIKVFIQHAPGVPNPNDVTSPTAVISVRGTVFDVDARDEDTTVVSVDEGEVGVRNLTAPGNAAVLHPGESITVLRNVPLAVAKIDKGGILQKILRATRDVYVQMPRAPGAAGPAPVPNGSSGGAQGDKGPNGGGTTNGPKAPPSAPGAPPAAPGAPPAPPGGGG